MLYSIFLYFTKKGGQEKLHTPIGVEFHSIHLQQSSEIQHYIFLPETVHFSSLHPGLHRKKQSAYDV